MFSKVSSKGQVVIPREIREKMNIKPGSFFIFNPIDAKRIEITIVRDPIEELHGIFEGSGMLQALEEDHRKEIEDDELYFGRMAGDSVARKTKRASKSR